ncbi:SPARC-related modular calcium-binding protein 2 isoform X2 [Episyrphus balteatus]|uniref:SPARC-related modular calcium-binding protein 2 isoform X2 n=1 Tax=Episyrphus balteatus TaxID=286459 RepID=UPI0024852CE0|nr:SPARC-related modular calcium-binding protein 2 isoform X2 [Episyrphus balteatus]
MILRSCFFLLLLIISGLQATPAKDRQEPTISECAAKGGECDETKGRPVCGTDDQTYPTRCHLIRVQCSGHQVSLKYRGPCKACIEAREYALKHKAFGKSPPKFIPRCKSDGTYAPVQCLGDSGCWCSDITGKPIENTSVRIGKPRCREFNKANIRRSPSRHLNGGGGGGIGLMGGGGGGGRGGLGRRPCSAEDRSLFNVNLLKVYQNEYLRSGVHKDASTPSDRTVMDWKFTNLDTNGNSVLDKSEYRELKKAVKRAVKPRRCSRGFGKFCDVDDDDKLSRLEWSNCISKDGINRHLHNSGFGYQTPSVINTQQAQNKNNPTVHQIQNQNHKIHKFPLEGPTISEDDNESSQPFDDYPDSGEYDSDDDNATYNNISDTVKDILRTSLQDSEQALRDSDGDYDCQADRRVALDEQNGGTALYVPECTPDGRYQRVQCYRSTGYCWCVHEDTGKNIPGTSLKDKRPQCDSIYPTSRPMKGCPEPRKTEFLKDLKDFLNEQIGSNSITSSTKWTSEDERIATLSFVFLDKNKNKSWERKEWKTFRELVTANKTLGKCGKKMPRYCDVNSDKKITLSEWLNCLNAQRLDDDGQIITTEKVEAITNKSKLSGSNPLEIYLQ